MPVQVLIDHKSLKNFMTTKKLTPKQVRWAEFLSEFNFVISYQNSKKNNKVNALIRKPRDCANNKEDEQLEHHVYVLLLPEHFQQSVELQPIEKNEKRDQSSAKTSNFTTLSVVEQLKPCDTDKLENSTLPEKVMQANQKEDLYASICAYLKDSKAYAKPESIKLEGCTVNKSLVMKENQLWVPASEDL